MGDYSSFYCSVSVVLAGVPDCLPSGNPILQAQCLTDEFSVDQVTCNVYKYDYDNKLFISWTR